MPVGYSTAALWWPHDGTMTSAAAFLAIMRRDLHVYLSYRTRLVSQVLTALFSLALFYYISQLVHVNGFGSHKAYFGFVVVGICLISVIYSCFSIPELVRQELIAGTFDRLLLSPFGAVRSVLAMTLFPMIYSFVLATITLGLGCLIFGLQLHWATVPLSIPVMLLVLFAFLPFGVVFASMTIVIKQGNVGTSWVIALLSIVGGLYFPVSLLPHWLQTAAKLQPFTAATDILRHLLVNSSLEGSPQAALLKLTGFAVVLLPTSILLLSLAIRFAQRRGTIIEY
jgi:ABC-2 type transport system permease protein